MAVSNGTIVDTRGCLLPVARRYFLIMMVLFVVNGIVPLASQSWGGFLPIISPPVFLFMYFILLTADLLSLRRFGVTDNEQLF